LSVAGTAPDSSYCQEWWQLLLLTAAFSYSSISLFLDGEEREAGKIS